MNRQELLKQLVEKYGGQDSIPAWEMYILNEKYPENEDSNRLSNILEDARDRELDSFGTEDYLEKMRLKDQTENFAIDKETAEEYDRLGISHLYSMSDKPTYDNMMADYQSTSEQLKNAAKRVIPNILLNAVSSTADGIDTLTRLTGLDDSYGNFVSDWARAKQEQVNKDNPIYKNENTDYTKAAFWIDNGESLVSSIGGFAVSGLAIGGIVGTGSKIIGALGGATGLGEAAMGIDKIRQTAEAINKAKNVTGITGEAFAHAYIMNGAESTAIAADVFKNTKQVALQQGYSEDEAKRFAGDAAAQSIRINQANILLNLGMGKMFMGKSAHFIDDLEAVKKGRTGISKFLPFGKKSPNVSGVDIRNPKWYDGLLAEAGQEALEEQINTLGQNIAEEDAYNAIMGQYDNDATFGLTGKRIKDSFTSKEGLESAFFGALGGIGQGGAVTGLQSFMIDKMQWNIPGAEKVYKRHTDSKYDKAGNLIHKKGDFIYETEDVKADKDISYQVGDVYTGEDNVALGLKRGETIDNISTVEKLNENNIYKTKGGETLTDSWGEKVTRKATDSKGELIRVTEKNTKGKDLLESGLASRKRRVKEFKELYLDPATPNIREVFKSADLQNNILLANGDIEAIINEDMFTKVKEKKDVKNLGSKLAQINKTLESANLGQLLVSENSSYADLRLAQESLLNKTIGEQAYNTFQLGGRQVLKEFYRSVVNLTPEEAKAEGYTEDYKQRANEALIKIDKYADKYLRYKGLYTEDKTKSLYDLDVNEDIFKTNLNVLTKKRDSLLGNSFAKTTLNKDTNNITSLEQDLDNIYAEVYNETLFDSKLNKLNNEIEKLESDYQLALLNKEANNMLLSDLSKETLDKAVERKDEDTTISNIYKTLESKREERENIKAEVQGLVNSKLESYIKRRTDSGDKVEDVESLKENLLENFKLHTLLRDVSDKKKKVQKQSDKDFYNSKRLDFVINMNNKVRELMKYRFYTSVMSKMLAKQNDSTSVTIKLQKPAFIVQNYLDSIYSTLVSPNSNPDAKGISIGMSLLLSLVKEVETSKNLEPDVLLNNLKEKFISLTEQRGVSLEGKPLQSALTNTEEETALKFVITNTEDVKTINLNNTEDEVYKTIYPLLKAFQEELAFKTLEKDKNLSDVFGKFTEVDVRSYLEATAKGETLSSILGLYETDGKIVKRGNNYYFQKELPDELNLYNDTELEQFKNSDIASLYDITEVESVYGETEKDKGLTFKYNVAKLKEKHTELENYNTVIENISSLITMENNPKDNNTYFQSIGVLTDEDAENINSLKSFKDTYINSIAKYLQSVNYFNDLVDTTKEDKVKLEGKLEVAKTKIEEQLNGLKDLFEAELGKEIFTEAQLLKTVQDLSFSQINRLLENLPQKRSVDELSERDLTINFVFSSLIQEIEDAKFKAANKEKIIKTAKSNKAKETEDDNKEGEATEPKEKELYKLNSFEEGLIMLEEKNHFVSDTFIKSLRDMWSNLKDDTSEAKLKSLFTNLEKQTQSYMANLMSAAVDLSKLQDPKNKDRDTDIVRKEIERLTKIVAQHQKMLKTITILENKVKFYKEYLNTKLESLKNNKDSSVAFQEKKEELIRSKRAVKDTLASLRLLYNQLQGSLAKILKSVRAVFNPKGTKTENTFDFDDKSIFFKIINGKPMTNEVGKKQLYYYEKDFNIEAKAAELNKEYDALYEKLFSLYLDFEKNSDFSVVELFETKDKDGNSIKDETKSKLIKDILVKLKTIAQELEAINKKTEGVDLRKVIEKTEKNTNLYKELIQKDNTVNSLLEKFYNEISGVEAIPTVENVKLLIEKVNNIFTTLNRKHQIERNIRLLESLASTSLIPSGTNLDVESLKILKPITQSEINEQVGNSNYSVKNGLIFYNNTDGTIRLVENPKKEPILKVIENDIKATVEKVRLEKLAKVGAEVLPKEVQEFFTLDDSGTKTKFIYKPIEGKSLSNILTAWFDRNIPDVKVRNFKSGKGSIDLDITLEGISNWQSLELPIVSSLGGRTSFIQSNLSEWGRVLINAKYDALLKLELDKISKVKTEYETKSSQTKEQTATNNYGMRFDTKKYEELANTEKEYNEKIDKIVEINKGIETIEKFLTLDEEFKEWSEKDVNRFDLISLKKLKNAVEREVKNNVKVIEKTDTLLKSLRELESWKLSSRTDIKMLSNLKDSKDTDIARPTISFVPERALNAKTIEGKLKEHFKELVKKDLNVSKLGYYPIEFDFNLEVNKSLKPVGVDKVVNIPVIDNFTLTITINTFKGIKQKSESKEFNIIVDLSNIDYASSTDIASNIVQKEFLKAINENVEYNSYKNKITQELNVFRKPLKDFILFQNVLELQKANEEAATKLDKLISKLDTLEEQKKPLSIYLYNRLNASKGVANTDTVIKPLDNRLKELEVIHASANKTLEEMQKSFKVLQEKIKILTVGAKNKTVSLNNIKELYKDVDVKDNSKTTPYKELVDLFNFDGFDNEKVKLKDIVEFVNLLESNLDMLNKAADSLEDSLNNLSDNSSIFQEPIEVNKDEFNIALDDEISAAKVENIYEEEGYSPNVFVDTRWEDTLNDLRRNNNINVEEYRLLAKQLTEIRAVTKHIQNTLNIYNTASATVEQVELSKVKLNNLKQVLDLALELDNPKVVALDSTTTEPLIQAESESDDEDDYYNSELGLDDEGVPLLLVENIKTKEIELISKSEMDSLLYNTIENINEEILNSINNKRSASEISLSSSNKTIEYIVQPNGRLVTVTEQNGDPKRVDDKFVLDYETFLIKDANTNTKILFLTHDSLKNSETLTVLKNLGLDDNNTINYYDSSDKANPIKDFRTKANNGEDIIMVFIKDGKLVKTDEGNIITSFVMSNDVKEVSSKYNLKTHRIYSDLVSNKSVIVDDKTYVPKDKDIISLDSILVSDGEIIKLSDLIAKTIAKELQRQKDEVVNNYKTNPSNLITKQFVKVSNGVYLYNKNKTNKLGDVLDFENKNFRHIIKENNTTKTKNVITNIGNKRVFINRRTLTNEEILASMVLFLQESTKKTNKQSILSNEDIDVENEGLVKWQENKPSLLSTLIFYSDKQNASVQDQFKKYSHFTVVKSTKENNSENYYLVLKYKDGRSQTTLPFYNGKREGGMEDLTIQLSKLIESLSNKNLTTGDDIVNEILTNNEFKSLKILFNFIKEEKKYVHSIQQKHAPKDAPFKSVEGVTFDTTSKSFKLVRKEYNSYTDYLKYNVLTTHLLEKNNRTGVYPIYNWEDTNTSKQSQPVSKPTTTNKQNEKQSEKQKETKETPKDVVYELDLKNLNLPAGVKLEPHEALLAFFSFKFNPWLDTLVDESDYVNNTDKDGKINLLPLFKQGKKFFEYFTNVKKNKPESDENSAKYTALYEQIKSRFSTVNNEKIIYKKNNGSELIFDIVNNNIVITKSTLIELISDIEENDVILIETRNNQAWIVNLIQVILFSINKGVANNDIQQIQKTKNLIINLTNDIVKLLSLNIPILDKKEDFNKDYYDLDVFLGFSDLSAIRSRLEGTGDLKQLINSKLEGLADTINVKFGNSSDSVKTSDVIDYINLLRNTFIGILDSNVVTEDLNLNKSKPTLNNEKLEISKENEEDEFYTVYYKNNSGTIIGSFNIEEDLFFGEDLDTNVETILKNSLTNIFDITDEKVKTEIKKIWNFKKDKLNLSINPNTYTELENLENAKKVVKDFFEDSIDLNILTPERILEITNSEEVEGFFTNTTIAISELATLGTIYHESMHAVIDLMLSETEKKDMYESLENSNNFKTLYDKYYRIYKKVKPNITKEEVYDEIITEDFRSWILSEGKTNVITFEVKSLFSRLWEAIKLFFNTLTFKDFLNILFNKNYDKEYLNNLYRRIKRGDFKNQKLNKSLNNTDMKFATKLISDRSVNTMLLDGISKTLNRIVSDKILRGELVTSSFISETVLKELELTANRNKAVSITYKTFKHPNTPKFKAAFLKEVTKELNQHIEFDFEEDLSEEEKGDSRKFADSDRDAKIDPRKKISKSTKMMFIGLSEFKVGENHLPIPILNEATNQIVGYELKKDSIFGLENAKNEIRLFTTFAVKMSKTSYPNLKVFKERFEKVVQEEMLKKYNGTYELYSLLQRFNNLYNTAFDTTPENYKQSQAALSMLTSFVSDLSFNSPEPVLTLLNSNGSINNRDANGESMFEHAKKANSIAYRDVLTSFNDDNKPFVTKAYLKELEKTVLRDSNGIHFKNVESFFRLLGFDPVIKPIEGLDYIVDSNGNRRANDNSLSYYIHSDVRDEEQKIRDLAILRHYCIDKNGTERVIEFQYIISQLYKVPDILKEQAKIEASNIYSSSEVISDTGSVGLMNQLLRADSIENINSGATSYLSSDGETVYTLQRMTNLAANINTINTLISSSPKNGAITNSELQNRIYNELPHLNTPMSIGSVFLEQAIRLRLPLKYGFNDGFKLNNSNAAGLPTSDLIPTDRLMQWVGYLLDKKNSWTSLMRAADRSVENLIDSPVGYGQEDYTVVLDRFERYMIKQLVVEMNMIMLYKSGNLTYKDNEFINLNYAGTTIKRGHYLRTWQFLSDNGLKTVLNMFRTYLDFDLSSNKSVLQSFGEATLKDGFKNFKGFSVEEIENMVKSIPQNSEELKTLEVELTGLRGDKHVKEDSFLLGVFNKLESYWNEEGLNIFQNYNDSWFEFNKVSNFTELKLNSVKKIGQAEESNMKEALLKAIMIQTISYIEQYKLIFGDPFTYKTEADFFKRVSGSNSTKRAVVYGDDYLKILDSKNRIIHRVATETTKGEETDVTESNKPKATYKVLIDKPFTYGSVTYANPKDFFKALVKTRNVEERINMYNAFKKEYGHFEFDYGYRLDKDSNEDTIKTVIFKDYKAVSRYKAKLESIFMQGYLDRGYSQKEAAKRTKKMIDNYDGLNEADAGAYVSLEEYRSILDRTGKWTSEHQTAYTKIRLGIPLSAKEIIVFQPLKTQYFGYVQDYLGDSNFNKNGSVVGFYKHCLIPLIPEVYADLELGNLMDYMLDNGIGIAQFESATKVGIKGKLSESGKLTVNSLYNSNGLINLYESNPITQLAHYKYIGIQVDTEPKMKTNVTAGTQIRKIITSLLENAKDKINYFGNKGVTEDLIVRYTELQNQIIETELTYILAQMEIEVIERTEVSSDDTDDSEYIYKIGNPLPLITLLEEESIGRDNPAYITESLRLLKELKEPKMEYTFNSRKINNILSSYVDKRVFNDKRFGAAKIQQASTGTEKRIYGVQNDGSIVEYTRDNKGNLKTKVVDSGFRKTAEGFMSSHLRYYELSNNGERTPDTKLLASECMIALPKEWNKIVRESFGTLENFNSFVQTLNEKYYNSEGKFDGKNSLSAKQAYTFDIKGNPKQVILDEFEWFKLTQMFSFRIPTQGVNSADYFRVHSYLPTVAGDVIIVPSEIVVKAGSDMDFDKNYVYFYNFKVAKDKRGKSMIKLIKEPSDYSTIADETKREELIFNDYKTFIQRYLPKEVQTEEIKVLSSNIREIIDLESDIDIKTSGLEKIDSNLNKALINLKSLRKEVSKELELPDTSEYNDILTTLIESVEADSISLKIAITYESLKDIIDFYRVPDKEKYLKSIEDDVLKDSLYFFLDLAEETAVIKGEIRKEDGSFDIEFYNYLADKLTQYLDALTPIYNDVLAKEGIVKDLKEKIKLDSEELAKLKANELSRYKEFGFVLSKRLNNKIFDYGYFKTASIKERSDNKQLQNQLLDATIDLFILPQNAMAIISPVDDAMFKDKETGLINEFEFLESKYADKLWEEREKIVRRLKDNKLTEEEIALRLAVELIEPYQTLYKTWNDEKSKVEKRGTTIDFTVNLEAFINFLSGKAGVGQTAVHITNHSLTTRANLMYNSDLTLDNRFTHPLQFKCNWGLFINGEYQELVNIHPNQLVIKNNNVGYHIYDEDTDQIEFLEIINNKTNELAKASDIKLYPSFGGQFDSRNNLIQDTLSGFLTAYVDIAKDPFVFRLGATNDVANLIMMLVRLGVNSSDVIAFIKNPIVKDYTKRLKLNETVLYKSNRIGSKSEPFLSAFLTKSDSSESLNTMKGLESYFKNIKVFNTVKPTAGQLIELFRQYLRDKNEYPTTLDLLDFLDYYEDLLGNISTLKKTKNGTQFFSFSVLANKINLNANSRVDRKEKKESEEEFDGSSEETDIEGDEYERDEEYENENDTLDEENESGIPDEDDIAEDFNNFKKKINNNFIDVKSVFSRLKELIANKDVKQKEKYRVVLEAISTLHELVGEEILKEVSGEYNTRSKIMREPKILLGTTAGVNTVSKGFGDYRLYLQKGFKFNSVDRLGFLSMFISLSVWSRDFQKMIRSTSPDTKMTGATLNTTKSYIDLKKEVFKSGKFINYYDMFEKTIIKSFSEAQEVHYNTFKNITLTESNPLVKLHLGKVLSSIPNITGEKDRVKHVEHIRDHFITYLLHTIPITLKENVKDTVVSKDAYSSLVHQGNINNKYMVLDSVNKVYKKGTLLEFVNQIKQLVSKSNVSNSDVNKTSLKELLLSNIGYNLKLTKTFVDDNGNLKEQLLDNTVEDIMTNTLFKEFFEYKQITETTLVSPEDIHTATSYKTNTQGIPKLTIVNRKRNTIEEDNIYLQFVSFLRSLGEDFTLDMFAYTVGSEGISPSRSAMYKYFEPTFVRDILVSVVSNFENLHPKTQGSLLESFYNQYFRHNHIKVSVVTKDSLANQNFKFFKYIKSEKEDVTIGENKLILAENKVELKIRVPKEVDTTNETESPEPITEESKFLSDKTEPAALLGRLNTWIGYYNSLGGELLFKSLTPQAINSNFDNIVNSLIDSNIITQTDC